MNESMKLNSSNFKKLNEDLYNGIDWKFINYYVDNHYSYKNI